MSTFGEIVEPSTRTAWEDWDDVIQSANFSQLHLENEIAQPDVIDTLLILEGKYLSDYVKAQHDLEQINSIPEVNLKLYRTKNMNNYVCVIRDYDLVLSSEIVELLRPYVTISNDVIAILTKPIVEYQVTELATQDYVIRGLYTSKFTSRSLGIHFPKLEQPNIISGVSAGVICLREVLELPAAAIVCYFEHPVEQKIKELDKLLAKFKVVPNIDTERSNLLNSNLYI